MKNNIISTESAKTNSGNRIWLNLQADGSMKIVISKPKADGGYDNTESVQLPTFKVKKLYSNLGKLGSITSSPSPTLEQLRAIQGQQAYAKWEKDEEERLRQLYITGHTVEDIAKALSRGTGAIESRLRKLGLKKD